jgi:hypothetical protein
MRPNRPTVSPRYSFQRLFIPSDLSLNPLDFLALFCAKSCHSGFVAALGLVQGSPGTSYGLLQLADELLIWLHFEPPWLV